MRIVTKEVRDGKHDGKVVWVSQYLQPDLHKKPLRHVRPTKVMIIPLVRPVEAVPASDGVEAVEAVKGERMKYTWSYFSPINDKGKVLKKRIQPTDSTGWRSYCGNEINVFENEDECRESYTKEVKLVAAKVKVQSEVARQGWLNEYDNLMELIKNEG